MKEPTPTPGTATWPRWSKPALSLLFVAIVASLIWSQLPGAAYPTDLSRIGAGRPALVLAHDANHVGGMEVMELMNAVRPDYAERVEFLVAHLGMADGRAFAERHAAADGTVLLFATDGRHLETMHRNRPAKSS
jgi:hypothetical protein